MFSSLPNTQSYHLWVNYHLNHLHNKHVMLRLYVVRCTILYHLYNLKNVKNTHGGVLLLVKLQAEATCRLLFKLSKQHQIVQSIKYFEKSNEDLTVENFLLCPQYRLIFMAVTGHKKMRVQKLKIIKLLKRNHWQQQVNIVKQQPILIHATS